MLNEISKWARIEPRTVIPGFHGRFVHSDTMTFVLWQIDQGATLPEHSHHHEQVVHLYEGEFELTVEGRTIRATPGTVFAIPGMGSLIVRGALQRDFPIVQGVVFAMVIVVIAVNLIADLLCAAVDPRIEQ